jgi:hypothetical protein
MIGPGRRVEPHNQIVRAMLLSFLRGGEVGQRRLGFSGDSKARQQQCHRSLGLIGANARRNPGDREEMKKLLDKIKAIGDLTWEDLVSDNPKPLPPDKRRILKEIAEAGKG